MIEIKEAVSQFDKSLEKSTRAGLPSCWAIGGGILSWDSYENLLVLTKIKVDNTHEKTQVLKGEMMINFLHRHFQLLGLVKTLLTETPYYNRITALRLEYHNLIHSPGTRVEIWKKCRALTIDWPKDPSTSKKEKSKVDLGNVAASSTIHIQRID